MYGSPNYCRMNKPKTPHPGTWVCQLRGWNVWVPNLAGRLNIIAEVQRWPQGRPAIPHVQRPVRGQALWPQDFLNKISITNGFRKYQELTWRWKFLFFFFVVVVLTGWWFQTFFFESVGSIISQQETLEATTETAILAVVCSIQRSM